MPLFSCEDQDANNILKMKTQQLEVNGVHHYATLIIKKSRAPKPNSSTHSVIAHLRATEGWPKKDPEKAVTYSAEINKLIKAGYVKKLQSKEVEQPAKVWYLTHHLVYHNNKPGLAFNCSFWHENVSLNEQP